MKVGFLTLVLLCGVYALQAQKANFSGNWQLDQQRSEFGNISPSAASVSINVDQKKDSIFIERMGNVHVLESLPVSGRPTVVAFAGGSKFASVEFMRDGTIMEENATYTRDSTVNPGWVYPVNAKEVWTLLDDNRTLQIVRTVDLGNNDKYSIRTVYTKQ